MAPETGEYAILGTNYTHERIGIKRLLLEATRLVQQPDETRYGTVVVTRYAVINVAPVRAFQREAIPILGLVTALFVLSTVILSRR